jgi:DNA polymerase-3 subunit gamma/tau
MGEALYRKYRSKSLNEVVGQRHITDTLSRALTSGRVSHAYLFTGPRGVGKTSIARILAHEINGVAYDGSNYLDIIEIDAASNRRIDEIRELRDKVHIAPAQSKYKVYIIDEVHMLTKEAFNALLKTLEEPPAHAVFILATTEAHKLPETITSRTQRFRFLPISVEDISGHLRTIAKYENIQVSDEALHLIARHAGGSFRDSISMLDQAASLADAIEETDVRTLIGLPPEAAIEQLAIVASSGDAHKILVKLDTLYGDGYQPALIAKQLLVHVRNSLHDGKSVLSDQLLDNLQRLERVGAANDQKTALDIALLHFSPVSSLTIHATPITKPTELATPLPDANSSTKNSPEKVSAAPLEVEQSESQEVIINEKGESEPLPLWSQIMKEVKSKHPTMYSALRMARTEQQADEITLVFQFAFHQKRIDEPKNKKILVDIASKIYEQPLKISTTVQTEEQNISTKKQTTQHTEHKTKSGIETITNIFGGAEVLES